MSVPAESARQRALEWSRYARRTLDAEPGLLPASEIELPFDAATMAKCLDKACIDGEPALWRALRMLRKRVMLRVIARDLGGLANLAEVVATVSALAETTLQRAAEVVESTLSAVHGVPRGTDSANIQRLHIIGMGKLGGGELNASSDIDLIFAYPEEGNTDGARPISNHEFFAKIARRLIAALNEITPEGRVFRVDMRLRPWGVDGPLACGFDMLEQYFVAHGREWERYAWIKARLLRGDRPQSLADIVYPFVFRRHLDYSAFESLRELHREIRAEVERRDSADNIKLGPGGIREIEFIVQLFQLIRGGRDAALRDPATLRILPQLAARHLLPDTAVTDLTAAYTFLRNLEHRLQYLDDRQTQTLPSDADDFALIAAAMGCADIGALRTQLDAHRARVTREFDNLFTRANTTEDVVASTWLVAADDERHTAALYALGYRDAPRIVARIARLRDSPRLRELPEASAQRLRRLMPSLLASAATAALAYGHDPETTLERMLDLVESISRREVYLTLLLEYPQAVQRSARLAAASPWAAIYLARHPILLDELLDEDALHGTPGWPALRAQLRTRLDESAQDTERQMDVLREFKHGQIIRLIAQDLDDSLPLEMLSDHLSDLADLLLAETLRVAWQGLTQAHRAQPRFAIIGYGKLGGREMGYASDLDIIFLYDDAAPQAAENYARLAQRINRWLSALTPAGTLYETDLRLRPDGASGLLVSSVAGFEEYQERQAWTWEHQALTRARFAAGDAAIGARFNTIRDTVLRRPRDSAALRAEVLEMREKMRTAHPDIEVRFDVKQGRGGLIDVEFVVQYLVLAHAHAYPQLTANRGNLALLELAAQLGLVKTVVAHAAQAAYRTLRRLQHASGLQGEKITLIDPATATAEIAAVRALWDTVLGET